MAVIEIDARLEAVLLDCAGCGRAAALTHPNELRDPEKLSVDHNRATGHKSKIVRQGTSYITLIVGPSSSRSGPMTNLWRDHAIPVGKGRFA